MYKVYLIGVYDENNRLRAIKIGQTIQDTNKRLYDIQKYANNSKALYNKGIHKLLAYGEINGVNAGVIVEDKTHKIITAQYSTINKYKGAKDYFSVYYTITEKTLIKRFKTCLLEAVKAEDINIISIKKTFKK